MSKACIAFCRPLSYHPRQPVDGEQDVISIETGAVEELEDDLGGNTAEFSFCRSHVRRDLVVVEPGCRDWFERGCWNASKLAVSLNALLGEACHGVVIRP